MPNTAYQNLANIYYLKGQLEYLTDRLYPPIRQRNETVDKLAAAQALGYERMLVTTAKAAAGGIDTDQFKADCIRKINAQLQEQGPNKPPVKFETGVIPEVAEMLKKYV
jgi:hypothetical protein